MILNILSFLRFHPYTAFQTLLLTMRVTPFHLRDSCPHSCPFELNSPFPVHFSSLISKMSMFTHHLLFDHFQFILIHRPNIPSSYAVLLFTASDFNFTTWNIQSWTFFFHFGTYFSWGSQGKNTQVFNIPFSSGPHSVRHRHHDPSVLGGPTRHGLVSLS